MASAAAALDAFNASMGYAEACPAPKAPAGAKPVPDEPPSLADLAERLQELSACQHAAGAAGAALVPSWAAYAEPLAATPRKVAGACRTEVPALPDLAERLCELTAAACA